MVQTTIEAMLRQKIGLDANSIGSNSIAYAIEQRRLCCGLPTLKDYYNRLKGSAEELDALIETVVVPETWFFRDREPFVCLKHWIKTEWNPNSTLRVLSAPCSTGEEPYSLAITLLEAGLSSAQFRIDAIDISQVALEKAKRATYTKRAFRGETSINPAYFQTVEDRYQVRSHIRETVQFMRKNLLEPNSLLGHQYQVIFCRNLLIYLDQPARSQVINTLDQALSVSGLLFVGSAETLQISSQQYQPVAHPVAFAYQKIKPPPAAPQKASIKAPIAALPKPKPTPAVSLSKLEQAKQLVDRGQLTEAAQLCKAHLALDRTNANAYLLLGKIYQELNQIQPAEQAFQKAIYLNPNFYDALIELAVLKEQQGDLSTATRLKARVQRLLNL
ncbi:protein-glutamate O-methyltransferase CheR [Leptolyngbya sp. FACHB-17]|uniref:CheR family methyltransferase n=1 Tax=unclassified Leptolyngbya TaxID=2650499 RepID=UPI0016813940|nr:protein-glutamate O-methyltransferase CheR [Leptolyngbya sp. FACHB-17]MBD2081752.1 tetratricopeptide repeat protein [Leptolyngbya sp. FACHB-17]